MPPKEGGVARRGEETGSLLKSVSQFLLTLESQVERARSFVMVPHHLGYSPDLRYIVPLK